jgi:hypothetical protein
MVEVKKIRERRGGNIYRPYFIWHILSLIDVLEMLWLKSGVRYDHQDADHANLMTLRCRSHRGI